MIINLALILTLLTLFSGIVVALDKMVWKTEEDDSRDAAPGALRTLVEYSRSFFPVLLFVLVIRSFIFEPFRIPSSSMVPTLLIGDFIFVNKYTYGLRLPVLNTKVLEVGEPARGDVVVFRLPSDPSTNYIKRLVGLPGDTVEYVNKRLYINGEAVEFEVVGAYDGAGNVRAVLGRETIDDTEHSVLLVEGQRSQEGTYRIPDGYFFMMGDNRDNSRDSRYSGVGLVPEGNVVGKAVRVWMNWEFPKAPQWRRIGSAIQ